MVCIPQRSAAFSSSYYAANSRLSSGKWIKVRVTTTGMQEITFDQLRRMGFTDPEKVGVFGYSGTLFTDNSFTNSAADDLPQVPSALYGEKLVFYGAAAEEPYNYCSNANSTSTYRTEMRHNFEGVDSYYYLSETEAPLRVGSSEKAVDSSLEFVKKAYGLAWHYFTDNHLKYGAYLYSPNITADNPCTLQMSLPGYDTADLGTGAGKYHTLISTGIAAKHTSGGLSVQFNDGTPVTFTVPGVSADASHTAFKLRFFISELSDATKLVKAADGKYTVTLSPKPGTNGSQVLAVNYLSVSYPRVLDLSGAAQHRLSFNNITAGQGIALDGTTTSTHVWVTPGGQELPVELPVVDLAEGVRGVVADRTHAAKLSEPDVVVTAFDPSRELNTVEVVGEISNSNFHAMKTPEMLIVAVDNTMEQAERLAQLHRDYTGLDVAVVNYRAILDEMASGQSHTMAVRRLAKMLNDRTPGRLKGVLLFARAPRDNTGVTAIESPEQFAATYIPMLQCRDGSICGETPKSYATDVIYGMLDDRFVFSPESKMLGTHEMLRYPLDVAVGRIPAINAGEATDYVSKVERYLKEPSDKPLYNHALVSADWGDRNMHMNQALDIRSEITGNRSSVMADMHLLSLYDKYGGRNNQLRDRMRTLMQRGLGYWIFIGHSHNPSAISNYDLWTLGYDKATPNPNAPFVVFATCETAILDTQGASLQVQMAFNNNGGLIAGAGAIRPVYAEYNVYFATAITRAFYTVVPGSTFGDVFKRAREIWCLTPTSLGDDVNNNTAVHINMLCYNFIGDPMLPMRTPQNNVVINTVNGTSPDSETTLTLNPLTPYDIAGSVTDAEGEVDSSFNGVVTITIYDGRHEASTALNADSNNAAKTVTLSEKVLQEVKFDVVNGRFSGKITLATPSHTGMGNDVSLFAVNADKSVTAVGSLAPVEITATLPEGGTGEMTPPVISTLYADDPSFAEGDNLPASFTLYADIAAGSTPLLGVSDRFGAAASVVLDDSRTLTGADGALKVGTDGNATLAFPVSELADGPHKLTLRVTDVAGQMAESTIHFNVSNVATAATLVLDSEGNTPAILRGNVNVDIATVSSATRTGRITVADESGHVVYDSGTQVALPHEWRLTDTAGHALPAGHYTISAQFILGSHRGSSTPVTLPLDI